MVRLCWDHMGLDCVGEELGQARRSRGRRDNRLWEREWEKGVGFRNWRGGGQGGSRRKGGAIDGRIVYLVLLKIQTKIDIIWCGRTQFRYGK